MEKVNLHTPLINDQDERSHSSPPPPPYYQATGSSPNPLQPQSQPQQSFPSAAPGSIPADNYSNTAPVQPQPIYQTNYYQQQSPPPSTQVVIVPPSPQVVTIQNHPLNLGPHKSYVTCPFCHIQMLTRVSNIPRPKAHILAAILCVLGLWFCVCLPYFMESCVNVDHFCGNCNKFLGTYYSG